MLADEDWEEEKAYQLEKASLSNPLTREDYERQRAELVEAAENELLETEMVMKASPGWEGRLNAPTDRSSPPLYYDQTKLDSISQLWGLPPDDIDDLTTSSPQVDEPLENNEFDGISQLWGRTPRPQSAVEEYTRVGAESFEGISQLWPDEPEAKFDEEEDHYPLDTTDRFQSEGDDEIDYSAYEGFEWHESYHGERLSQTLADEVWDYPDTLPDEPIRTLEDYTKKVVEILEAAEDEILETEAILRAPPAAESVKIRAREDDKKTLLEAVNETRPIELSAEMANDARLQGNDLDLAALGMDLGDSSGNVTIANVTFSNATNAAIFNTSSIGDSTTLAGEIGLIPESDTENITVYDRQRDEDQT